jgi:hypothetical protein
MTKRARYAGEHLEPGARGIATIKHMDEHRAPFPDTDAQCLFFGGSQFAGKNPFCPPPTGDCYPRLPSHPRDQPRRPLHPHHSHWAGRRPVKDQPPFGALASLGFDFRAPGPIPPALRFPLFPTNTDQSVPPSISLTGGVSPRAWSRLPHSTRLHQSWTGTSRARSRHKTWG